MWGLRDANGNSVSIGPGGVDTLGRTLVSVTQNGTSQLLYTIYDANGNAQTVTVNLSSVSIATQFNTPGGFGFIATEASGTMPVVSSIVLPNGQKYSFTYESGSYGGITSMTVPSGATIHYTWATTGSNEFTTHRYVASRSVTVNGTTSTYSLNVQEHSGTYPATATTTVTDPAGNQQVYASTAGHVQSIKEYSGSVAGTPLREIDVAYEILDSAEGNAGDGALPTSITTILSDGGSNTIRKQTQFDYDQFTYNFISCPSPPCTDSTMYSTDTYTASRGNVVEKREYDWGALNSTSPGALVRRTHNTFLHDANSNYIQSGGNFINIVDRLATQIVYDGAGNVVSQTDFAYDGVTPPPLSGVPQHGTPATNYRGNLTTVSRWRNTDGAWLGTTYTFDDTGNITAITDPLSHTTQWNYADAWAYSSGNCLPTADTLAYPTTITDAKGHQKKVIYEPCTGQQQSVRDANDLANSRAGTTYTYDDMDRPLTTSYADGGLTTNSYTDSLPNTVTTTVRVNNTLGVSKTTVVEKDYLGRDRKTTLTSDPDGATYTRVAYDAMSRTYKEWDPTRCDPDSATSCAGETTFGYTTHLYDPLGRETSTIKADGSTAHASYSLNTTTATDEAGVARTSTVDGLGRLIQVSEVNMGWLTAYKYDTLGNLTCVEQHGGVSGTGCAAAPGSDASSPWRVRRFTYNSLSELLAAKNPEAGTSTASCNGSTNPWSLCYTYNNDGMVTSRTDARGVVTNYGLDALHRVTQKSYPSGDATITYAYDGGAASANGLLHRTAMSDASGSTSWTFDSEGRILAETRTIAGYTKTITNQYNQDGSLWKLTYPSNAVIDYAPGNAGRVLAVHDDTNNIQYATAIHYAPQGSIKSALFGQSSAFSGITETDQYNTRLQPSVLSAAAPAGTRLSLSYDFHLGSGDNGNVYAITNNRVTARSQTFTYDADNRITQAQSGSTWGATFTIDPWGNLTQTGAVAGTSILAMSVNQQVNNANRFTLLGYAYDGAGNVVQDGLHTGCSGSTSYTWNSEEQMTCAAGTSYTYDGDGGRVKKTGGSGTPTFYWGGEAGDALAESNTSGTLTSEYIFLNNKRVARRDLSGGAVYYYFSDMLGSSNVVSDAAGNIVDESDFYPYGGERQITNNLPNQHYKFTGKERDSESGNDYFGARYYASTMGRFMSPDWSAKVEPVPYAKLDDPQSLNLYSYVSNNPLARTDPDGHCFWDLCIAEITVGDLIVGGLVAAGVALGVVKTKHQMEQNNSEGSEPSSDAAPSPPKIVIDGAKHPESAQHAAEAQAAGHPKVVTIHRPGAKGRRQAAQKGAQKEAGKHVDEYPPAVTKEGGEGASTKSIQGSDNSGAGASMGNQMRPYPDGTQVEIVPTNVPNPPTPPPTTPKPQ